jgi:hypothetical protein
MDRRIKIHCGAFRIFHDVRIAVRRSGVKARVWLTACGSPAAASDRTEKTVAAVRYSHLIEGLYTSVLQSQDILWAVNFVDM